MDKTMKLEAIRNTAMLEAALNEDNVPFTTSDKNQSKGNLENGKLVPSKEKQSIMVINDGVVQSGTKNIIPGIDNIWLIVKEGILYDFTIWVNGACPKGKWDNHMTFTDRSGDTYHLRIYDTKSKDHYVNYHSPDGAITKITWDI